MNQSRLKLGIEFFELLDRFRSLVGPGCLRRKLGLYSALLPPN